MLLAFWSQAIGPRAIRGKRGVPMMVRTVACKLDDWVLREGGGGGNCKIFDYCTKRVLIFMFIQ